MNIHKVYSERDSDTILPFHNNFLINLTKFLKIELKQIKFLFFN